VSNASNPCALTATKAGDNNYNLTTSAAFAVTLNKAATATTVTAASAIYDGSPHGGTAVVVGSGLNQALPITYSGISGTVYAASTTAPMNPGNYSATASYAESANYLGSTDTKTFTIEYGSCNSSVGAGQVILPPINSDGTSVYNRKGSSTIPVKFRVCNAAGGSISTAAAVFGSSTGSVTMLNAVRGTVTIPNEETTADIPDVAFRWDASGQQWMFNMAMSNLSAGTTYTFRINLAYGPGIQFVVGVK
jgi:hypothetical protein